MEKKKAALAYIVGVALGDGNLSNPNKRGLRLRISCDARYTHILSEIQDNLRTILPKNKVSLIRVPGKPNIVHVSIYSNELSSLMPWKCGHGPKYAQRARVPNWILSDTTYRNSLLTRTTSDRREYIHGSEIPNG